MALIVVMEHNIGKKTVSEKKITISYNCYKFWQNFSVLGVIKVSKVGDRCRGGELEGSFFNSYYTEV